MHTSDALTYRQWLTNFLSSRTQQVLEHVELYKYQMGENEYLELIQILKKSKKISQNAIHSNEWCGLFTLYCAEWFRREYSLNWSWEPILEPLHFELSILERNEIIKRGLIHYWKRPLSRYQSDRCDYLGSVFKEGGLPSNLLVSNDNKYQTTFNAIFDKYTELKQFGDDALFRFIRSKIKRLPETLQGSDSIELIISMVKTLEKFVIQFDLGRKSNPAAYLDSHYPKWRDNFPLPLDDEVGTAFLTTLLSKATKAITKATVKKIFFCQHFLSFTKQQLNTQISLPNKYTFNFSKADLTSARVELVIFEGHHAIKNIGNGFVNFNNEKPEIQFRDPEINIYRDICENELYLTVMQAGRKIDSIRLVNSSVELFDAVLTLIERDDQWKIISQVSAKVKDKTVGILAPVNAVYSITEGICTKTLLTFNELVLSRLTGKCQVTLLDNNTFSISTGIESLNDSSLILKGNQLPYYTEPALVYTGLPRLVDELGSNEIFKFSLNGTELEYLAQEEKYGRQTYVARNIHGDIIFRKRIGILPKDFFLKIIPGNTPNNGTLLVETHSPCICNIKTDAICKISSEKKDGVLKLEIEAEDIRPVYMWLEVMSLIGNAPIRIRIPFPSLGALVFDANGQPLKSKLSIEELLGSRVLLFAPYGSPTPYEIELREKATVNTKMMNRYMWRYLVTDKPIEIDLYRLKKYILSFLSLHENLDTSVELEIKGAGSIKCFDIRYYSSLLNHDREENTISINLKLNQLEILSQPELISLFNPEQKSIPLKPKLSEGVDTGTFWLPHHLSAGGPWLIVPNKNSTVHFRAKLISGQSIKENSQILTLQKAAVAFNPSDKVSSIANVLSLMADDFSHPSWHYIRVTFKNFNYLPLATFQIWRHLIRDPKALAVAVFIFECDEKFIAMLNEQLPVCWEYIQLVHWQHAIRLQKTFFLKIGVAETIAKDILNKDIEKLSYAIPVLGGPLADFLIDEKCQKLASLNEMQRTIQDVWYQDLLREHCDDEAWPVTLGHEIKQICDGLNLMPFELEISSSYQTGVVYAPIFAAAMAAGLIPEQTRNLLTSDVLFRLRQLNEFDADWFNPVYQFFLSYFTQSTAK